MPLTINVVWHGERKAELIRDCLLPFAMQLADRVELKPVFLQRHWKFGPHVRVCVVGADDMLRRQIEQGAMAPIEDYLRDHPSPSPVDPVRHLALSQRLGDAELDPPPYGPLWPDNSIVVTNYEPRGELLGEREAVRFKEEFMAGAMHPVSLVLQATPDAESKRLNYLLAVLVILAASYPNGGLLRGSLSYRSHLEEWFTFADPGGRLREAFRERFDRIRRAATEVVRNLLQEVGESGYEGPDPVLQAWSRHISEGWRQGLELARSGQIREDPAERFQLVADVIGGEAARRWRGDRQYGAFHMELRSFNFLGERVDVVNFSTYRWLVNLVYATLPLMDVSPTERYFLGYVVAECAEEITGVTWRQHFASIHERYRRP